MPKKSGAHFPLKSEIIVYLGIRAGEVPSGGFFGDFEVAVFLMDGADHSMVLTSSRSPRR